MSPRKARRACAVAIASTTTVAVAIAVIAVAHGNAGSSSGSGRRPSAPSASRSGKPAVSAAPPSRPATSPDAGGDDGARDHLRAQRPRRDADRFQLGLLATAVARRGGDGEPHRRDGDERAQAGEDAQGEQHAAGERLRRRRRRRPWPGAARGRDRAARSRPIAPALGDRRQARGAACSAPRTGGRRRRPRPRPPAPSACARSARRSAGGSARRRARGRTGCRSCCARPGPASRAPAPARARTAGAGGRRGSPRRRRSSTRRRGGPARRGRSVPSVAGTQSPKSVSVTRRPPARRASRLPWLDARRGSPSRSRRSSW